MFFKFIFREKGREEERESNIHVREVHINLVASPTHPTGDLACNLGVCPDGGSNQQAGSESTEPHQPGLPPWFLSWETEWMVKLPASLLFFKASPEDMHIDFSPFKREREKETSM